MTFFQLREPENTHKHLGRGLELASSSGGGSVPSEPRLTNNIGNFDDESLVKIRNIEKPVKNFVFGSYGQTLTILSSSTRRSTYSQEVHTENTTVIGPTTATFNKGIASL